MTEALTEFLIGGAFWVIIAIVIVWQFIKVRANRPGNGAHPTTINKSSSGRASKLNQSSGGRRPGPTISSDGHSIPRSRDITCEGQYGHSHENMGPRYVVHEEPTTGYCNLNGKIVALKDCWKY
ncbi:MAG: hypothetical protein IJT63_04190 [Lachnospiraceae bacterium]|nr:hypothetical protein [Lachnospiraceae bacterium]